MAMGGTYPDSFRCPLGRTLMRDPVTAADGHSYERANIEQWFVKKRDQALTSPMTGLRLPSQALVANITLRKSIEEFFDQQKKQQEEERERARMVSGGGGVAGTAPSGLWDIPEGRLQVANLIDKGSFGEVRRGVLTGDDGEQIPVAIKLLLVQTQAEERDMFEKELQVLHRAAMRCQHACRLYGTCVKNGQLALVMKMYTQSLDKLMRAQPGRRFSPEHAARYSLETARAIAELHACAIIIQDLKPPNLLLDEFDNLVVADFGLSAVIEGTRLGTRTVKGTFNYMAPEAFDPVGHGGLTVKADCWSWACCVIELFTGHPPWENDRMAVIMQKVLIAKRKPDIPAQVPSELAEVLRRCFASDPQRRPSFVDMLPVLQSALSAVTAVKLDARQDTLNGRGRQPQPRLVQAVKPVNKADVEQARGGGVYNRYAGKTGQPVGKWVEERRREREDKERNVRGPGRRDRVRAAAGRGDGGRQNSNEKPAEGRTRQEAGAQKSDWIEYKDPKTGRPYFHNKITQKTVWCV